VTAWALFVRNLFLHGKHLTSIIPKAYATSKGEGLLETSGMMAEPALVDYYYCTLIIPHCHCSSFWLLKHDYGCPS
jgi:hypothetical protein